MLTYDAHTSLFFTDSDSYEESRILHTPIPNEERLHLRLKALQKAGITFVRDMGDLSGVSLKAKELAGDYGITLLSAGWPLCPEGCCGSPQAKTFRNLEDFKARLQELREAGADFVHLLASGAPDLSSYGALQGEPMEAEFLKTLIAAAKEAAFPVAVSCSGSELAAAAIEAEADSLEYGWYMDNETLRILAESDTVWVPLLSTAGNSIHDEDHRFPEDTLKRILDETLWKSGTLAGWGGNIALGSNAGAYRCPQVQAALDEYDFLKEELGDSLDSLLSSGEVMLRWKFSALPPQ